MSDENKELLPCPFCGGEAKQKRKYKGNDWFDCWIACEKCGCRTSSEGASEDWRDQHEDSRKSWNTRINVTEKCLENIPYSGQSQEKEMINKLGTTDDNSELSNIFNKILFNQPLYDALYKYQNKTGEIISEIGIVFNTKRSLKSCITAKGVKVVLQSRTDFIGDGI